MNSTTPAAWLASDITVVNMTRMLGVFVGLIATLSAVFFARFARVSRAAHSLLRKEVIESTRDCVAPHGGERGASESLCGS